VVRRVAELDRAVRAGQWGRVPVQPLNRVQGRTLGLVGFGHAAREVARKLGGFEMRVLAHDPFVAAEAMAAHRVVASGLHDLLAESDYVSLHCPLTPATRHLIGERELRLMKPTAVLLNTARGPVVDESALAAALREGWARGGGTGRPGAGAPARRPPVPGNEQRRPDAARRGLRLRRGGNPLAGLVETVLTLARGHPPRSWVNRPAAARGIRESHGLGISPAPGNRPRPPAGGRHRTRIRRRQASDYASSGEFKVPRSHRPA